MSTGSPAASSPAASPAALRAELTRGELRRALEDLAALACTGVPGCAGASVSLLHDGTASTLAATHEHIEALDQEQYQHDDGPCLAAMRAREAVSVDDYDTDGRWPHMRTSSAQAGVRSSLSLPLDKDGRTLGGLNMYGQAPGAFTDTSRQVADVFARQAMLMLGYLQQLHTERAEHAREHQVAATLQRSLLPTLPTIAGISSAARYLVSGDGVQVGGDWYDLFALPDGVVGVAIGDVMGHDVAAAAAMGQLRSVLRSYAYEGSSPSVVLDRLDRLVQGFDMAEVATAIYGRLILDAGAAMLLFSNAGHLPPLVRHPDGTVERLDRGASPLIGVLPSARRSEAAVALAPGSLLVLYTDGLVETRHRPYDHGIDLMASTLAALNLDAEPDQVCDTLLDRLVDHRQDDDIALLTLRIHR
jgi:serine phosphatase RsbU (regulator of sigma subunit)